MTRVILFRVAAVIALIAGGWWLSANTEWVDEDVPRLATGEARTNPVYAFEQIMRRLGMQAEHHEQLDRLPPEGARLVLLSSNWDLVPGRAGQLRAWVERGGHLVLVQGTDWDETRLESWVPVFAFDISEKLRREARAAKAAREAASAASKPMPAPSAASAGSGDHADDEDEDEDRDAADSEPPIFGDIDSLDLCYRFTVNSKRLRLKPGHQATWTLTQDVHGQQLIRAAHGRGTVTVLNATPRIFQDRTPFDCDLSLVLAATVQAEPGATVWVYLNEKREALTPWLWHSGWIAIVLGLLALAAWLWRAAVRFGPRLAPPPRLRRSISEQVRGMGAYLHRHGGDALLAAQQRALEEAATRRLRGYARPTTGERVHAVATATGVARDDLYAAMSSTLCTRAELPARLHLLETARRLLLSGTPTPRLHDERPSQ